MHEGEMICPKKLRYQILALGEGNSVILEVCEENDVDFLHGYAISKEEYELKFLIGSGKLTLTISQLKEIIAKVESNTEYIDYAE